MKRLCVLCLASALFLLPASANASVIISLEGDKDCFGLGGSCPDGTNWRDDLGGVFFTNYQDPGDPAFTDIWFAPGTVSYSHSYVLDGAPVAASLELRIAGVHDINLATVYDVRVNGSSVGVIPPNLHANAFQEVLTYTFAVPVVLLSGPDAVSLLISGGDGFSIDYSELSITTSASVPEPTSLLLLATGIAGVARRRFARRS